MNSLMRRCRKFAAAAALCAVSACTTVEFGAGVRDAGPPVRATIELVDPSTMFRTALTEARLDEVGCTYELTDPEAIKRLRLHLFDGLVAVVPHPDVRFEPRNKLVFYFSDGRMETLVFSRPFDQHDAIDAQWQGLYARVANSLPAELADAVRQARLPQLNPAATQCAFLA
jgi:hypothetical protein